MAERFISERNLKFLLYRVFHMDELTRYPYYQDHSEEIFDMVLDTALKLSKDKVFPILEEMDTNQPEFIDGHVTVHPHVRDLMGEFGEGGWINANYSYEFGGQQLPLSIVLASRFIFFAANYSASVYPSL
ncbi:MAG: acyl-CoA dehydrogenase N-terminal domain-containing protein, partial [Deltaproteobacteria bacterium]|nr:acyl-CoA dehydrogenase N-terminal domain-containing protein [Deltaproteobacteria bacterium]